MAILDIIHSLDTAKDRLAVEQILIDLWMSGERNFFTAAQLARNFDINYDIFTIATIEPGDDEDDFVSPFTFVDFHQLCNKLRHRYLTTKERKQLINDAASIVDAKEWNDFYRHILLRSWPWVKIQTINKILKKLSLSDPKTLGYMVREFELQGHHIENKINQLDKIKGTKVIVPVITGDPAILVLDKEYQSVTAYYEVGQTRHRILLDPLASFDILPCSMALEVVVQRINDVIIIHLYDCMPLQDYYKGECFIPYNERQAILSGALGVMLRLQNSNYRMVQKLTVNCNTPEGKANLEEFAQMVYDEGHFSIYVKDPDAPYQVGKNKNKNSIRFANI
jgi:hypothetical protein